MSGPEAKVRISADDSPLRQSLREMVGRMRDFGDEASKSVDRVNTPLATLRDRFVAFAAVFGGGALFGKAVAETAKMTESAIQLGKAMGSGTSTARTWMAALEDAGATTEDLSTASKGLLKNLRSNEDGLNAMGLRTRDANGHLRTMDELMLEAIKLTNDYAEGTDRQVAAAQLFGKGVAGNSNLLKVNAEMVAETAAAMRELGMVVGEEDVAAFERYDSAMDRLQLTKQALITTLGNALMPVLTKLAEWFNAVGPAAVTVVRGAVGGLVSVFWGLKNAVVIVWESVNAMVFSVAEPIRSLASALYKVVTGDFKGAQDELMNWPSRIAAAWGRAGDAMVASSVDTRNRIRDLFLDGPEAGAKGGGGSKRATTGTEGKTEKAGHSSYMAYYEGMLAEEKRAQSVLDSGAEYRKEQELAFWRFLQANLTMTSADRLAVLRKTAGLELEIARQARQQRQQLEEIDRAGADKLALAKVEAEAGAARAAVELGHMTKAQLAALEVQFEQQRFQIQSNALNERLRLLALDPNTNPAEMARLKNELLLLEQQHELRRTELLANATKEKSTLSGMLGDTLGAEAGWQNMLNGILARTMTWRQAMGGLLQSVGQIFVQKLVTEPVAQYVAGLAKMLLVKLGFLGKEQIADQTASTTKQAIKGEEMMAVVGANAAEAGSGAAASQASIPYVGPVLALAAMAAVFAAVSAMGAKKSAAGGYDIPAGVNPLVQTHAEEMILPSPLANAVRRMAERDDEPSGGAGVEPVQLPHHAIGDFVLLMRPHFLKMLKNAKREFSYR